MKPKGQPPTTTRFLGSVSLGKREATFEVVCYITLPPNLTPAEKAKLERFDLATALASVRPQPGRAEAILASIKAKLDTVSVSDYLRPADEIADEARAARGARARVAADTKRRAAKKAGKKRAT